MSESREVASAFAELARTPAADAGKPLHLSRLLRHCLDLTGAAAAHVLTADAGEPVHHEASPADARELLDCEMAAGSGPALDCVRYGDPIGPVRVAEPSYWPHLAAAARAAGYGTVQAYPLRSIPGSGAGPIGALVLYSHGPLDATRRHLPQALADSAAATIAGARALNGQATRVAQLQQALTSRIVIEQAKGVLAERHHTTPDDAFTLIRSQARTTNQKIHAVASAVIASTRV